MVSRRWFTLMAVSGLSGVVASLSATACSDGPDSGAGATGGADAAPDVSRREASPPEEEPPSECPLALDFQESEVDTELKGSWKPPTQTVGACTKEELATFGANLSAADESTSVEDVAKGLGTACKACLFSTTADAAWQLVVAVAGGDPTEGFVNFGACHAVVNGSSECGRAYQYNQFCVTAACSKCTDGERADCLDAVWSKGGACERTLEAVKSSCASLQESEAACTGQTVGHAAVLCGPKQSSPVDAGVDASDAAAAEDAASTEDGG